MAAVARLPFSSLLQAHPSAATSQYKAPKQHNPFHPKRPRSPEVQDAAQDQASNKRSKCTLSPQEQNEREEKRKRAANKQAQLVEFRVKYTKAFPGWTFYFDTSDYEKNKLAPRVLQLNAKVAKFFSNEVTHFITNHPVPVLGGQSNKENTPRAHHSALKSPIKMKGRAMEDGVHVYDSLVKKAVQLKMKIWDCAKLDSVLSRCLVQETHTVEGTKTTRSLTSLLESERRHGTSERDPTQRRHDYIYFSKNSYFVLVEDVRGELATIAAMEYPVTRTSDGSEKGDWPVLHCHPKSRNPFVPFDDKEAKRWARMENAEKDREQERAMEIRKKKLKMMKMNKKKVDLRKTVSISNLRGGDGDGALEDDGETSHTPQDVSGYLSTGYIAASGNSVNITSTNGTTSTTGLDGSRRLISQPPLLRRLQTQVVTTRRASAVPADRAKASTSLMMPPPLGIPCKSNVNLLKRSKSTNHMRLPKREETSKPGYCESCRLKFDDFTKHVQGRKHLKFAENQDNFKQLDAVLSRVRRRTIEDVARESETVYCNLEQDEEMS